MARELEFLFIHTQHPHILLFLEGVVIEDLNKSDQIISAELATVDPNWDLRGLVKKLNIRWHPRTEDAGLEMTNVSLNMTQMILVEQLS